MTVSFDYDGSLDRPDVQQYCQELIGRGYEVFVCTMRYNKMLQHLWTECPNNDDLWKVVDTIGIPRENVIFTNMMPKSLYLQGSKAIFHIDDLQQVHYDITHNTRIPCVMVQTDYREECEKLLKEYASNLRQEE